MKLKRVALMFGTCILLAAFATVSASAVAFEGGTGIATDPYLISTKKQLNEVRNNLDKHFKLTRNITFTAADFAEGGAFYNEGAGWIPIGETDTKPFYGTFDGDGKTISGLCQTITSTSKEKKYGGLFGYVKRGGIKNLNMADSEIIAKGYGTTFVGGIAGYLYGTDDTVEHTIYNCSNSGNITCNLNVNSSYAGGIAGCAWGASISSCNNSGTIQTQIAITSWTPRGKNLAHGWSRRIYP